AANNLTHSTIVVGRELTVPNRGEAPPKHKQYVVKSGDTLWQIAKRHQVSVKDIQQWNTLNSKTPLKVGQVLSLNAQSTSNTTNEQMVINVNYQIRLGFTLSCIACR